MGSEGGREMTADKIPKDASLVRCVVKKSLSILEKLVLYASYVIVASAGIVVTGFIAWKGLDVVTPVVSAIYGILISIPWYWYVGVVVVLAIPVYSLLWCVARGLTEEDWQSELAGSIALAVAFAALALATTLALAGAVAFAGVLVVALALATTLAALTNSKVLRFIGAYLHYRKRIKKSGERR